MNQRIYFDINSQIGRTSYKEERIPYSPEVLLSELEYYRIQGGLICNAEALSYSYLASNKKLLALCADNERLYPMVSVPACAPFESGEGVSYYARLVKEGAKAFMLSPAAYWETFTPFFYSEMMEFLAANKIPAFICVDQTTMDDIVTMATEFPQVNFVILNESWGMNRSIYPMMSRLKNLYMDISANQANDVLDLCKKQGFIDRVLFGTYYPYKMMGGLKALVEYSDLTEHEKDMVASLNACKLLGIDHESLIPFEDSKLKLDSIACCMDQGLPITQFKVLDCHTHMVDPDDISVTSNMMLNSDYDSIIKKMDKLGIDLICTAPWEGITTNGIRSGETVLNAIAKYPDRIIGYACCNPNYQKDLDAIESFHSEHHFPGVKPYWIKHNRSLLDPVYANWFEYANKHNLFMLIHSDSLAIISDIKVIVKRYPGISFLLAHTGSSYDVARAHVEICKSVENVWLEITYTTLANGLIEYLVDEVSADRVLYGSDLPMRDPAPQMAWVAYAKISQEDKIKIFGTNFQKIIDCCHFD